MTRSVDEWIGRTDDAAVPPRVRIRVFERCGGICHISGRKIGPADQWDIDHIIALANGGRHAESNLAPALRDKHREKTADDVAMKSKVARTKAKHLGVASGRKMDGSRGSKWKKKMDGSVVRRDAER